MSAVKTDGSTKRVRDLLLVIGSTFIIVFVIIYVILFHTENLSLETNIKYLLHTLAITTIIFGVLVVSISGFYTLVLSLSEDKNILAKWITWKVSTNKNIELECQCTEHSLEKTISSRFSIAIQQLGNEKIEARLGAIYALEKIAQDSNEDTWTIVETLAAFIRENAPIIELDEASEEFSFSSIPTDIQAALTVIGRSNLQADRERPRIDLRNTDLRGGDLTDANLQHVDFTGADLQGVIFYGANLSGACLITANLSEAVLYEADLQKATLYEANLKEAIVRKANLREAILYKANLEKAVLYEANLQEATLYEANLQEAMLYEANLREANLEDTNLYRANLIGANLQSCKLIGAYLEGTILSTANLCEANLYEAHLFQANFCEANLSYANLVGTDLKESKLYEANLCGADLTRAKNIEQQQIESAFGNRDTILPDYLQTPDWEQK